jgi:hypothetical protein
VGLLSKLFIELLLVIELTVLSNPLTAILPVETKAKDPLKS